MKHQHLPLIIGISLPVVFILIISILIYAPSLSVKPAYDFIYSEDDTYYNYYGGYKNTYKVIDGRIELEPISINETQFGQQLREYPALYKYDIENHSSHQLTLEEAHEYVVDPGPSSPDGYTVTYEYRNSGIFELFGSGSDSSGTFISKGKGKKRLSGITGIYGRNVKIIGWIK